MNEEIVVGVLATAGVSARLYRHGRGLLLATRPARVQRPTERRTIPVKTKDPSNYATSISPATAWSEADSEEYLQLRESEAWTIWGAGNGAASEVNLRERVRTYRSCRRQDVDRIHSKAALPCETPFFANGSDDVPQLTHWSANIVASRGY